MARRRERRAAPTANRKNVYTASHGVDQFDSSSSERRPLIIFVLFFIVIPAVSVIIYSAKFGSRENPKGSSVRDRGIVKTNISYKEILTEHSKVAENVSRRHYTYPVLAYITPWNSKGYEIAKTFNSKFTHLSPVWYELRSQGTNLLLQGRHNVDKEWMAELRRRGNASVLPRVVLEAFPTELLRRKKLQNKAVNLILTECQEMEFDGIVLESWSRWAAYGILHDPNMRNMALLFVKQLGDALHSVPSSRIHGQYLQLVYVIGPPRSEKREEHDFGAEDLQSLKDSVDGFSLMTYDFSGPQRPGPNSPIKWIEFTLRLLLGATGTEHNFSKKIFLGLNFYGNDFLLSAGPGGGPITGRDYISILEKHSPTIQWDKKSGEHFFVYNDDSNAKHAVFYPTLMSILLRLEDARLWGTGISIWEIGQGLDYFFDLL